MLSELRVGLFLSGVALLPGCLGQTATVGPAPEPESPPDRSVVIDEPDDHGTKNSSGGSGGGGGVPEPGTPTKDPPILPPSTPAMSLDPNTCLTLVEGGAGRTIQKVDLVSGTQTAGPLVTQGGKPLLSEMTSIGVKDDAMWLCNTNQGMSHQTVTKISLETGVGTAFSVPCWAVTASAGGIFVLGTDRETITRYADEAAISAGTPSGTTSAGSPNSYNIGAGPAGPLTSRYTDTQVASATGPLTLQGFSGYIFGLSAATGGRVIVSSPANFGFGGTGTLESFDAATGAHLGTVATWVGSSNFAGFWGLACAQ